jgi:malate dehydrogenase (oxaloacetate-decarboxylating)
MDTVYKKSMDYHRKFGGKITTKALVEINNKNNLSLAYTPGVAEPCRAITKNIAEAYNLTWKGRTVAVISDGSAVLGLGNIGAVAAIPVMEGKALLIKKFAGIDAVPIVINTQNTEEIIRFVQQIAPNFAGVNLEDISAPRCFQIEESLQNIGIPVFHDDQHGTAIAVTAALHNAAKVVKKPYSSLKVIIVGAGAAGIAISRMLLGLDCLGKKCFRLSNIQSVADLILVDKKGALYSGREDQNIYKQVVAVMSNKSKKKGSLDQVAKGADAIIGVSGPNTITEAIIRNMSVKPIVFAMANPTPEILPDVAKRAGAYVVATGRSDFPNQINNVLVFPGVFKAVVQKRLKVITTEMKIVASRTLEKMVKNPTANNIIPDVFTPNLADKIARAILRLTSAKKSL